MISMIKRTNMLLCKTGQTSVIKTMDVKVVIFKTLFSYHKHYGTLSDQMLLYDSKNTGVVYLSLYR